MSAWMRPIMHKTWRRGEAHCVALCGEYLKNIRSIWVYSVKNNSYCSVLQDVVVDVWQDLLDLWPGAVAAEFTTHSSIGQWCGTKASKYNATQHNTRHTTHTTHHTHTHTHTHTQTNTRHTCLLPFSAFCKWAFRHGYEWVSAWPRIDKSWRCVIVKVSVAESLWGLCECKVIG